MTTPDASRSARGLDHKPKIEEMDVHGVTDIGKVRKVNQDHFLLCSLQKRMEIVQTSIPNLDQLPVGNQQVAYLAMVADGVGGGPAGEEASRLAIRTITNYVQHSMDCY